METCFISPLGFTHRTWRNTHNASGVRRLAKEDNNPYLRVASQIYSGTASAATLKAAINHLLDLKKKTKTNFPVETDGDGELPF